MDIHWTKFASGIISPEGPAVDAAGNVFLVSRWTGKVVRADPAGHVSVVAETSGKPQSVALLPTGDLLVADANLHALLRMTPGGEVTTIADTVEGKPFLGPNDLVVFDENVVYMTDPGLDMQAPGQLLRIEIDTGNATVLATGFMFPNGITISADSRLIYMAESVTHRVLRFEIQDRGRRVGPPEVFHQFDDHHPDGIAFDSAGHLLVTQCGGGTLEVLSGEGSVLHSIPAGGSNCTNCVFGGNDFQTLYLTEDKQEAVLTARWPVPGQREYTRSLLSR
ncbi:MAG: SMP-30/gluconolactonase/LRE family protein [Planctomycetaceae bacterium]